MLSSPWKRKPATNQRKKSKAEKVNDYGDLNKDNDDIY